MNPIKASPRSLRALLTGIAPLPPGVERRVSGLASDSRQVRQGDLFLAIQGLHHHGLEFLSAVREAGAVAVAWEPPYEGFINEEVLKNRLPLIAVEKLSHKLGLIAERFYDEPSRTFGVVGITGTDGKTSCAHYIAQSLDDCGLLGTLGYGVYGRLREADYTTPDPLTLWRSLTELRAQGVRFIAMEVSSHALEQGRVAGLDFTVAVLTNLTRDHLDYHGNPDAYAAAKRRLFVDYAPRYAVLNLGDSFGRQLAAELRGRVHVVGYGLEVQQGNIPDVFVGGKIRTLSTEGIDLEIHSCWGDGRLQSGLLGRFNASNLLAALATLLVLGIPFSKALKRLSQVSPVPGRMERLGGYQNKPLVVVDYAHTPNSLEQVLRALREYGGGRLWCVFGCGGDRDPGKRPLMGTCAERFADRVIVTDDNPRTENPEQIIDHIMAGIQHPGRVQVLRDRSAAIAYALTQAAANDMVLIAGKGHENYQIVGTQRLPFSDRQTARQCLEEKR